jgi:hypothetical protein
MNHAALVVAIAFAMSAAGCARVDHPGGNPIIVELFDPDETIIIAAGSNEPVYSLQSGNEVVARNLSLDDLRTRYPDVYQRLMSGYAQDQSLEWAGMNVEHHTSE